MLIYTVNIKIILVYGGEGMIKLFKSNKKFIVRLTGRGKQLPLGIIEAKNHQELLAIITDKLQDLTKQGQDITVFSRIRILDTENGNEISIENPFFSGVEEAGGSKASTPSENFLSVITDTAVRENLIGAITFISQLNAEIMKTTTATLLQSLKDVILEINQAKQPQQQQSTLADLAKIIQALPYLVENKEKVKGLLAELFTGSDKKNG